MTLLGGRGLVSLDLLRTIAALAVAVAHFFLFCAIDSKLAEIVAILAVEVFFILSGFVLARQLNHCIASGAVGDLKVFYLRRWIRTLPPFLCALLLTSAVTGNLTTTEFWKYIVFLKNFFSANDVNDYFAVTWSLAVEEWFYVVFPLALVLLTRLGMTANGAAIAFAAIILLIKLGYIIAAPEVFEAGRRIVLVRLDAIAAGYLLYNFRKHPLLMQTPITWLVTAATASLSLSSWALLERHTLLYMYAVSAFACLLLVLFLRVENILARRSAVRLLSAVGANLSYTIYLCHTFVFLALFSGSERTASAGLFVVYMAAVIAYALVSFFLLEAPLLDARPQYSSFPAEGDSGQSVVPHVTKSSRSFDAANIVTSNLLVCAGVLALTEGAASLVLKGYAAMSDAVGVQPAVSARAAAQDATSKHMVYSDSSVPRDLQRHRDMPGSPYRYQSYLTYGYRPFASLQVNIDEEGVRRAPSQPYKERGPLIWVFGSSPVFGATNGDAETVPAYMEAALRRQPGWETATVVNYGVVGYTSTQDLLHFMHRLRSEKKRPGIVVFLNGHNDFNMAWLSSAPRCGGLLETAVGSARVLSESWELRSHGQVILWSDIGTRLRASFPGTQELTRLATKFFALRKASTDVVSWRSAYAARIEQAKSSAAVCAEHARGIVLRSTGAAIQIARLEGIDVALVPQPILASTRKSLVGTEREEMQLQNDQFFALPLEELSTLRKVPRHRLDQKHVWDKAQYVDGYKRLRQDLQRMADKMGAFYLDLEEEIEKHPQEQIYSSTIHFTFKGATLIGERIAQDLASRIRH